MKTSSPPSSFTSKKRKTSKQRKTPHKEEGFPLLQQPKEIRRLVGNQNAAAVAMAKPIILRVIESNANTVFSPLSINLALFVATGSKGPTRDQFLSFLNSDSLEELNTLSSALIGSVLVDGSHSGGPMLSFVNGAWIDQSLSFKPDFKHVADNVYKARTSWFDFENQAAEVATKVNEWAESGTNGLITNLIPPNAFNELRRVDKFDPESEKNSHDDQHHERPVAARRVAKIAQARPSGKKPVAGHEGELHKTPIDPTNLEKREVHPSVARHQ
ncbi:OLC1v1030170C1 [Oldenlandia corymbosa var. corymbosa]|uniref:OLC1v1030170C1 n=1 Tax=Oldenlandia corymbosa var. corymbosa TaxID=529605 RepID=A0AAV1CFE4_OLDCO|nr:OLC1v1030170C1 [Oldenlandia corymbosa var. corymbosa]